MTSILEGELAETITEALLDASVPYDVVLTREVPGEPDPEEPWIEVPPIITHYPAKGFTESYSDFYVGTGIVQANDQKVVVLIPTLGSFMPAPGDKVTVRGKTLTIMNASPDPALATVELQARG